MDVLKARAFSADVLSMTSLSESCRAGMDCVSSGGFTNAICATARGKYPLENPTDEQLSIVYPAVTSQEYTAPT